MSENEFTIDSFEAYVVAVKDYCKESINLFRGQNCDKPLIPRVARNLPKGIDIKEREKELLSEFIRLSIPYITKRTPKNEWEWLSMAQHHGLHTRLLDWSTNPLVALYFAVQNYTQKNIPVVWSVAPSLGSILSSKDFVDQKVSPFDRPRTLVFKPPMVTERLRAQQGWFTVHKVHKVKGSECIPLENQLHYSIRMKKFIIKGKPKDILRDLDNFGINQATIYPDLDGLCKHISWKHFK